MALTNVNWHPDRGLSTDRLWPALRALPHGGRVTLLIHGYRFDPDRPDRCPHSHILGLTQRARCWKAISWPRHLHMDRDAGHLGIAFGWPAVGNLRPIAARATQAGQSLATLLTEIATRRPDLRLSLFAHSLGARVALSALATTHATSIDRIILLSGAEYRDTARAALQSPAGRRAHVLNVRTLENLPFDLAFRLSVSPARTADLPLNAGLANLANWTDLRIDCPRTRATLEAIGHRIGTPRTRFCHWSGYLRPGLFPVYRRVLSDPAFLQRLRSHLDAPALAPTVGGRPDLLSPL
ncbi:alpha/beta hydrolase [Rhodobacterales bacterium HKCCE4037]|nr:alpha/beta hydrolase [Rhodobacterales bacterium HKCCE4037]